MHNILHFEAPPKDPNNGRARGVAGSVFPSEELSAHEVLPQGPFMRMLCLERKRSERSRRPFVLMLLESSSLLKKGVRGAAFEQVLDALYHSTRETDIKGWYREGSVIGVIFTELGESVAGCTVAHALLTKVTNALSRNLNIEQINRINLSFHVFPEEWDQKETDREADVTLYPDLLPEGDPKRASRLLKRLLDIAGSLAALVVFSPVFLAIALLVKLSSRGPVLYRCQRLGQYGRKFTFLKFRSMRIGNDPSIHEDFVKQLITGSSGSRQAGPAVYKLTDDPRITPLGNFLRRTSLDELPQFFNVLLGDMSLVGPRPPLSYEFRCYDLWHKKRLLAVKPGITGLWQVEGRSVVKFDDMVRMDLRYASSWTVWMDLKILFSTPRAVLTGHGAY